MRELLFKQRRYASPVGHEVRYEIYRGVSPAASQRDLKARYSGAG